MNAQILAFLNPENSEEPRLSSHLKKIQNLATGKLIHIRDGEVTLYKRTKSARWQMTFRLYNKKWLRITTGYSDLEYAKKKAGEIYDRARFMEEMGFPISPKKFKVVAEQLITELQQDLDSGVGKKIYVDYLSVLKAYLIPFFGKFDLAKIDHKIVSDYDTWRNERMGRRAKSSTLATHSVAYNKVYDLAIAKGWLSDRHLIPRLNTKGEKGVARPAFTRQEIDYLREFMQSWVEGGKTPKAHAGRHLLRDYIEILLATGIRHGTESLNIQWRHLDWHVDKSGTKFLRIWVDGKTGGRWLIARNAAIPVLERVQSRFANMADLTLDELISQQREEYLWRYPDGTRPYDLVSAFKWLMKDCGLLFDNTGRRRSMYSFRHTYATLSLIERDVDIHTLAKQMGNSAAMIERHYSKLTPTMVADKLA